MEKNERYKKNQNDVNYDVNKFLGLKSDFLKMKKNKKMEKSIEKINALKNLRNPKNFWKLLVRPRKK